MVMCILPRKKKMAATAEELVPLHYWLLPEQVIRPLVKSQILVDLKKSGAEGYHKK